MTAASVHMMSADEVRARRDELVAQAGGDLDALRARGRAFALDARELALLDEIDGLDYLLNGPDNGL